MGSVLNSAQGASGLPLVQNDCHKTHAPTSLGMSACMGIMSLGKYFVNLLVTQISKTDFPRTSLMNKDTYWARESSTALYRDMRVGQVGELEDTRNEWSPRICPWWQKNSCFLAVHSKSCQVAHWLVLLHMLWMPERTFFPPKTSISSIFSVSRNWTAIYSCAWPDITNTFPAWAILSSISESMVIP